MCAIYKTPSMKQPFAIKILFLFLSFNAFSQSKNQNQYRWSEEKKAELYKSREDSTKWFKSNFEVDLKNYDLNAKPINFGVFPGPDYVLIDQNGFNGLGNISERKGIALKDKKIVYNSFFINNCLFNKGVIGDKPNEVYFLIVVLTDSIDSKNSSHMDMSVSSRNHPDYIGEGYFKTKNNQIDYVSFLTGDRNSYAIVNMRLFDLNFGRIILVAPQKDGSLRSMQLKLPVISSGEVKSQVENLLKEKEIISFFTKKGNI